MKKSFTYGKIVKSVYLEYSDENEDFVEEFEYEVDHKQLLEAVVDLVYEEYFMESKLADRCDYSYSVKKSLREFIIDNDNLEELVERYEYELKNYFEEEAFEMYN